jgi:HK97 family phage major capsid protein
MTLDEMIQSVERAHSAALQMRAQHLSRLSEIRAAEVRGEQVSAAEVKALRDAKGALDNDISGYEARIADLHKERADDEAMIRAARQITPTNVGKPAYNEVARVGMEPRTYQDPKVVRDSPSYLRDLVAHQLSRDPAAGERLARHGREVETDDPTFTARAVNTGAVSGLVPPQYLVELFAEYARAGRPVANLCQPLPLPDHGLSVNISRITTPTTVGVQTAENAGISNQDIDDTLLSPSVNTIAGYVGVSRQALERGQLVEEVIFGDLARAYNTAMDAQVVNGSGASGQHRGILNTSGVNSVSYTDASPTVQELWPKLASSLGQIQQARFTGATGIVMNPATWAWMQAALDTVGRPFMAAEGVAQNPLAVNDKPFVYGGPVGTIWGVPVIVSGNVPTNLGAGTNETRIIAADFRDVYLWENSAAPTQMKVEQPLASSLGVQLVVYGYSAFTAGRQPAGVSVISGTGLITPAL